MKFLYNDSKYKNRRRDLRKNQTDSESILWSKLRNKQCNGFKFFRQYGLGEYILDFYCPELRLAIELDGGQHAQKKEREYDQTRTNYLTTNDVKELRFWNNEITENLDGVYEKILEYCK
jgi:very-short-patch-repair endonuclease